MICKNEIKMFDGKIMGINTYTPIPQYGLYAVCLSFFLLLPFSPLLSCLIAFVALFVGHKFLDDTSRRLLGVLLVISSALVYGSRIYFIVPSDDFIRYYEAYERLLQVSFFDFENWINVAFVNFRYELGLPLYYGLLTSVFGELHPSYLLFFTILLPSVLMLIWLERYGLIGFSNTQKNLCVVAVFLFFSFMWPTWLTRQAISSIFILYALYARLYRNKCIFSILAIVFHISAIPLLIILFCVKKYPKSTLFALVVVLMAFVMSLDMILSQYSQFISPQTATMLKIYSYTLQDGAEIVRPYYVELLMLICIFVMFLLPNDKIKRSHTFILYALLPLYLILYFFTSGSMGQRSSFLLYACIMGFLLFLALRRYYVLSICIIAFFLLLRIKALVFNTFPESVRNFFSYPAYGEWFYYLNL